MVREALVEEIRSRADLVEICGEHMSLKRVGKSYRGPCPLHGGDDPNFSIDPSRGIFKCFVCGEGGDVFGFVMKLLGHEFPEAVRYLGERVGVRVPDREEEVEDPHAPIRQVTAFAAEWFRERLEDAGQGARAREHLASRDLGPESVESFAIGFAPDSWRALREAAHAHGLEDEELLEAGLLASSERAAEPYDRFRNRIIFPIRDLGDRAIGFGGRDLSGEEDVPKYINSPDSPIFQKGNTLYGLNRARHAMRRQGFGMVTEGYMDVLALHARGARTAVAPLGTALTAEQASTLARYANEVYLLYDSDEAGLRATFRSADTLLAVGVQPLVVTLPEGEDPDSLVRKEGMGRLRELLEDAVDVVERKLQELEIRGYLDSVRGRRRAVDGLLSTLRAVRDPSLRDLYVARAAERIGVREETLEAEVERSARESRRRQEARRRAGRRGRPGRAGGRRGGGSSSPGGGKGARTAGTSALGASAEERAERNLLLLFVRSGEFVDRAREAGLAPDLFADEALAAIYGRISRARERGEEHGDWDEAFEGEELRRVRELAEDATELADPEETFEKSLRRVLYRPAVERKREIDRLLARGDLDEERERELALEYARLSAELREAGVPQGWERKFLS